MSKAAAKKIIKLILVSNDQTVLSDNIASRKHLSSEEMK
jgi:hypothetical protein